MSFGVFFKLQNFLIKIKLYKHEKLPLPFAIKLPATFLKKKMDLSGKQFIAWINLCIKSRRGRWPDVSFPNRSQCKSSKLLHVKYPAVCERAASLPACDSCIDPIWSCYCLLDQ